MIGQISKIDDRYLIEILAQNIKEFEELKKFKNKNVPKSENSIYMGDIKINIILCPGSRVCLLIPNRMVCG